MVIVVLAIVGAPNSELRFIQEKRSVAKGKYVTWLYACIGGCCRRIVLLIPTSEHT